MSNKDQASSNSNSKLNKTNSSTEKELSTTVSKTTGLKQTNLKQFLQSKQGQYSLISVLVLGVLLISGLFTYNLLKQDDTAKAANTAVTAFNPSDCATYTSNGGTNTAGVCFVKLYEKNGQLFSSLDIAPGELVNVRNYYNNTTTASVTAANITDSMPANFTRVGAVTNNYVDATPVTLNNNVFTGQNLSVAPGSGYFGYAGDNSVTSSNLELGRKKFITQFSCAPTTPALRIYRLRGATDTDQTAVINGATDTECETIVTGQGTPWQTNSGGTTAQSYLLAGQRYITQYSCVPNASPRIYRLRGTGNVDETVGGPNGATYNECETIVTGQGTPWLTNGGGPISNSYDMLGQRYLTQISCVPNTPSIRFYKLRGASNSNESVAPNGATFAECETFVTGSGSDWQNNNGGTISQGFDTSDTARGYGYISYSMQAPTTGLTNGQTVGTTATLAANGNKASGTASSLTVTNVATPNISYTKLYSVDGGTTWSPTVSANPGQSVLVRLWNENTGGLSATEANIRDSLPNTFTYVPGSARNCLNPSTTTITSPNNTELVCDTGTATQKDSLFSTLTNASGVSPSAGLYDAAGTSIANGGTAFNAVAGTKEIGKFRYLNGNLCTYYNGDFTSGYNYFTPFDSSNTVPTPPACPAPSAGFTLSTTNSGAVNKDTTGKRFYNGQSCEYSNVTTRYTYFTYLDANNTTGSSIGCPAPTSGYTNNSGVPYNIDMLGERYVNGKECTYVNAVPSGYTAYVLGEGSNVIGTDSNCPAPASGYTLTTGNIQNIDTLDASRSKSFIEYEMIIPSGTASGNYGTTSTIESTATTAEFTPVSSGANGSGITVNGDPAFSVKKLLALPTSGSGASAVCPVSTSSYSTSLSNTIPGSTICVRLAYQNKTSGAVSNAAITDTLSSGFTYINNSTSNCLTPVTGSELCASDASQANTNWTGNNGWTGSNFTLSPHSGFYGQAASGATANMEMGKKRYANYRECSYLKTTVDYVLDRFMFNLGNTAINTFDCASIVPVTYTNNTVGTGSNPQPFLGTRYLHMRSCSYGSTTITDTNLDQFINHNNTANETYDCVTGIASQGLNPPYNIIDNGGTDGALDYDLLSNRYLHIRQCSYSNSATGDTILDRRVIAVDNISSNAYDCNSFSAPGYTNGNAGGASSYSYDLLDPSNGQGYIQYKMTSPTNPTSSSITLPNVSLSGDSQTTSTGNAVINFTNLPEVGCTTTDPCALFDTALTYSPTQALAKRYGGSGSSTADNLILTLKDTRLETSGYITTCTFRYKFKSDTTWRNLSSSVAYNNTTGCTSTLLTADQLFWNVDFEITSVTTNGTTTKNYLLYSNYDFKAGSIGVTSIGGSGL